MGKQLKFGLIMQGPGRGWADWLHPDSKPDSMTDFPFFAHQAHICESAKFDFLFLADGVFITPKSAPYGLSRFEPLTIMSALAVVTSHIGLVGTVTSTYSEPFNVARQFASLDHISGGRGGWNLVTSFTDGSGANFSKGHLEEHETRYRRAAEHLEVVKGLWDSWEDDAFVYDRKNARFFDPAKVHTLDHQGEFYQVKGPLNIKRSPQGHPVIFQAGASETGRDFAAQYADVIFVAAESIDDAKTFYADVKRRAKGYGRNPDHLLVVPGMRPIIGLTDAEAEATFLRQADLIDTGVALSSLAKFFDEHDFSGYDLDGPFPAELFESSLDGFQSTVLRIRRYVDQGLTLRQVAQRIALPRSTFVGVPKTIADTCQAWLEAEAADGFMVADTVPGQLQMFAEHVIPLLQKRGLARVEYQGSTLRENLGLPRPANRFATRATDDGTAIEISEALATSAVDS